MHFNIKELILILHLCNLRGCQIFFQRPIVFLHFGCRFLSYIPEMPGFILIAGYFLLPLWITQYKTITGAVFTKPDIFSGQPLGSV